MCAMLGAVFGLVGAAVSAAGSMSQANAQANQDEYDAKVAKINARSERQMSYAKQEDIHAKTRKNVGEGVALASAGGVDPNYGSAALVIFGENAFADSVDSGRQYVAGESAAIAQENKAKAYEASAAAHRQAGKIAAASSFLGGMGGAVKSFGGGGSSGGGGALFLNG